MERVEKYLIAIVPPPPIASEVTTLKEYFRDNYKSKASLNAPPHVTLHMPFEWKAEREQTLVDQLGAFSSKQQSFSIKLNGFNAFPPRVIFIDVEPNEKLMLLQKSLMKFCKVELNLFNSLYQQQPYHPHVTLAFRDLKKDQFEAGWNEFRDRKFGAQFECDRISLLKHNGKVWLPLKDLPLI